MLTVDEIEARVLQGGDDDSRRAIFRRFFASGAPRKLRAAQRAVHMDGVRVLELGCGYGVHLVHLPPGSLGLDADPERVAFARSLGLAAAVRDLDAPGWSRGCLDFDVVLVVDLLMHLRRPDVLFAELAGTLRPGGTLVLAEWILPEGRIRRALAHAVPGGRQVWNHPEHLRHYTRADLVRAVDGAGLEVQRLFVHSFSRPWIARLVDGFWPPHTLVARRPRTATP